ncbi:hypothetical protein KsCSTR_08860 [Candidatus Kuenenia stuttgartiensis]|uniref:Uncharacterized protein n=1 Tax=Kuenenia stuttgartiensis TaxID=174633 RepID=Q1PZ65_KUEST|nr:hypothetical protein KsCSTR_08860 [Candidatus Kuenenia stuttgartiensis]CAJ72367.1 unknown protein [Candidatus Kuenenia stuttgartiensis]
MKNSNNSDVLQHGVVAYCIHSYFMIRNSLFDFRYSFGGRGCPRKTRTSCLARLN